MRASPWLRTIAAATLVALLLGGPATAVQGQTIPRSPQPRVTGISTVAGTATPRPTAANSPVRATRLLPPGLTVGRLFHEVHV